MKKYEASTDPQERTKLLNEVQAYLLDNYLIIPVLRQAFINCLGPRIANKAEDIEGAIPQYVYIGPYEDVELKARRLVVRTYILRRLGYSAISLFLLSMTIFFLIRATGDPASLMVGPGGRPEDMERTRDEWGLDRSWPSSTWLRANLARGDFGDVVPVPLLRPGPLRRAAAVLAPARLGRAADLAADRHPAGIITAVKVDTALGHGLQGHRDAGPVDPGLLRGPADDHRVRGGLALAPGGRAPGTIPHLVMPSLALGWYFAASMLRLTRLGMLEVLDSEYVKLARLKGVPERVVIAKHAFKNALIPVLTLAGINFVVMVNVAVIIETIFAWPGIGRLLFEGIQTARLPGGAGVVIMAGLMIRDRQPVRRPALRPDRPANSVP